LPVLLLIRVLEMDVAVRPRAATTMRRLENRRRRRREAMVRFGMRLVSLRGRSLRARSLGAEIWLQFELVDTGLRTSQLVVAFFLPDIQL
jgi:hypothetical protein